MMKEKYESISAVELKAIAKARGLKNLSGLKKSEVVTRMLEADEKEREQKISEETEERAQTQTVKAERPEMTEHAERSEKRPEEKTGLDFSQLDSGQTVTGILEVMPDGFGFIRSDNYLPGDHDIYVSPSQIRRFNLKTGDIISGNTRIRTNTTQQEKFAALLYLKSTNGMHPAEAAKRCNFEDMTPIFPNQRMRMERDSRNVAMRIVDLISPVGKGQRGMIVSPPKAGKTTLLKEMAKSILGNDPNMHLIILLIDHDIFRLILRQFPGDRPDQICGDNHAGLYRIRPDICKNAVQLLCQKLRCHFHNICYFCGILCRQCRDRTHRIHTVCHHCLDVRLDTGSAARIASGDCKCCFHFHMHSSFCFR